MLFYTSANSLSELDNEGVQLKINTAQYFICLYTYFYILLFLLQQWNHYIQSCPDVSWKTINRLGSAVPEGSVDRPVPADEGHGGEEEEPEDGQTEVHTVLRVYSEVSQAGQQVEEESDAVDCGHTGNQSTGLNSFRGNSKLWGTFKKTNFNQLCVIDINVM